MIKIVARITVKEGEVENFRKMAAELIEKSAAEEGNEFYTLNQSLSDPQKLAFIEGWKDQAAMDYHQGTEHFTGIFPKLMELCEGWPQDELFEEV